MGQSDLDISVVVPCYRDPDLLDDLLQSLPKRDGEAEGVRFEVIVIDSGLDDRVAAVADRHGVRCRRGPGRLLPGDARNLGVDLARGEIVAFIDCDCVAEPGWIDAVAAGLKRRGVMIGGPVLDRLPWYTIASVDNLLQFADVGPRRAAGPVPHVPSCNMAMRREDFLSLGGFEHRDQQSGEDVLLTSALNRRWPEGLIFVPDMRVRHLGRRTLGVMLRHHHGFGYTRGALRLHLTEMQQKWGRLALLIPAVALKRINYIMKSGLGYGRTSAGRFLLVLPLMLLGMLAWAVGFRRGLMEAARR
ncbi:MAG: glycosyltransferase [Gemmatimonadetes bacterium]|nr:glycosyltransferase [Gemmatimonadota bacterium]